MKYVHSNQARLVGLAFALMAASAWAGGQHQHSHDANAATEAAAKDGAHQHGSHAHGHEDAHGGGHGDMGIGQPGRADQVTRTIDVAMSDDMRFSPAGLNVKRGETVRLRVKNVGQLKHELVLGTPKELAEHYQQMLKFPGMEHEDPQMVSVAPGQSGEILWTFDRAGVVDFACLQAGHYDAGMKGQVQVK
jgi:uncharacterized cupredoxin-like copper-binding protein